MPDFPNTLAEFLVRPLVAIICAGVLGWEREASNKPAGLRTMMMVGLGAAGFTAAVFWLYEGIAASAVGGSRVDPLRIVEGVVGGIGFLGAGSIIQSRGSVQGVTTAATIWVVGAIGTICGVGHYTLAITLTAYAWLILRVMGRLEQRFYADPVNPPGKSPQHDGASDA
jgi:putative Mg2+ transporter-C (MgtC) family protein